MTHTLYMHDSSVFKPFGLPVWLTIERSELERKETNMKKKTVKKTKTAAGKIQKQAPKKTKAKFKTKRN